MNELPYLAGVFDGEGSMGVWSKGKDKSPAFRLQVEMADGDVVLKFLTYFKKGSLTARQRDDKYKIMYHWRVNGEEAKDIAREMLPYLSRRRQAQFVEALA
tara:strand:- start:4249 stop:4551 length:303 start_codon:yes stop_codon:yes gene_type:complete